MWYENKRKIVRGDTTTHGGRVISASSSWSRMEDYACVGDSVDCPRCGGIYSIESGPKDQYGRDLPYAIEGQRTGCGATLVSRFSLSLFEDKDGILYCASADFKSQHICDMINRYGSMVTPTGPGGRSSRSGGSSGVSTAASVPINNDIVKEEEKPRKIYDEQVRVIADDTGKPISDMKYVIRLRESQTEISRGITDSNGLTERVVTDSEEVIEIFTFDVQHGTQEVYIDAHYTNTTTGSIAVVRYKRGRLFFAICYDVPDKAFERAGIGYRFRSAKEHNGYRAELGDIWLSYTVKTESDFVTAWNKIAMAQKRWNMEVAQGHILTHGSLGDESGLDFAEETEFDIITGYTVDYAEVKLLLPLKWAERSSLYLHSCRSGIKDATGVSLAEVFSEAQKVPVIYAQDGLAFFSRKEKKYESIEGYDGVDIYLWSYRRPRNILYVSPPLYFDNSWIPPVVIRNNKNE